MLPSSKSSDTKEGTDECLPSTYANNVRLEFSDTYVNKEVNLRDASLRRGKVPNEVH